MGTSLAIRPITTASSASYETSSVQSGSRTGSSGPTTAVLGLKNNSGEVGTSLPSSSAWACQLRPTPTTLDRGSTGVTNRTSDTCRVSVVGKIRASVGAVARPDTGA